MPTLNMPLENGRLRLNEATQAVDGLVALLAGYAGGSEMKADWFYAILAPIQDNLHQAMDELQYADRKRQKIA